MTNKNSAAPLVWLAGLLLAVSLVFPNGLRFSRFSRPAPTPEAPVVAPHATDPTIVSLLANADSADKARIADVYTGLAAVLKRPKTQELIVTTEQWVQLHERTLQIAIDTPGKYPGLDVAIDALFKAKLGTDDVLSGNPETLAKLVDACDTMISSASVASPAK
jgi:hypothetical protein